MLPLISMRNGLAPLLLFWLCPAAAIADIHTWVDAAGVHHFSSQPPIDDHIQSRVFVESAPYIRPFDEHAVAPVAGTFPGDFHRATGDGPEATSHPETEALWIADTIARDDDPAQDAPAPYAPVEAAVNSYSEAIFSAGPAPRPKIVRLPGYRRPLSHADHQRRPALVVVGAIAADAVDDLILSSARRPCNPRARATCAPTWCPPPMA